MRKTFKYLIIDVDGVMTTGHFIYGSKGKLYKMKEVKFELIHTTDNKLMEYMKQFFPTTPQFNSDDGEDLKVDIIKKYKKALEW